MPPTNRVDTGQGENLLNGFAGHSKIQMAHGGGGYQSSQLVSQVIHKHFKNQLFIELDDAAVLKTGSEAIAFTTDSYVVRPIFFRGGDIGKMAVCGTVNDLSVQGAIPLFLSVSFIIEEGFVSNDLLKIVKSIKEWSDIAGVKVVTGDTKVVEIGSADGIYMNTSGIGVIPNESKLLSQAIRNGDAVLVSGTIGDHGIAILAERNGLDIDGKMKSDCAPLNGLIAELTCFGDKIKWMRDITRGGLASCLNELACSRRVRLLIAEEKIPVGSQYKSIANLLGIDILSSACEGKMTLVVEKSIAHEVVSVLKSNEFGNEAAIIGEVIETGFLSSIGNVIIENELGARRVLIMPSGELLPRIC